MANIKPLSADLQQVANVELGEIPSRIPADLAALKQWIQRQPHLKARCDDQFLIQFLRGCKYSLERVKDKIDHFYALKTKFPELFSVTDVDNRKFRACHNMGIVTPLPVPLNDNGPRIMVTRLKYSPSKYCIEELYWSINAMHEVMLLNDPYACIQGVVYIMDMAGTTASHLLQFTPNLIKKLVAFYEKALPIRIKAVYCINASSATEQFSKLGLSLTSEKLRKRSPLTIATVNMANIKPLSAHLQQVANEELGEVPSRIPDDLAALKLWIQHQPHLKARCEDQFLIQFLRGCKYSMERVKDKIDHFYALKTKYPELFSATDVDNAKFRASHNLGIVIPLPVPLNECGPRIQIFRFKYSPSKDSIEEIYWSINAMQEVLLLDDPYACIQGVVYVMDMAGATASHLLQFTPNFIKKLVSFYEKTLPLRIKAIHCINASPTTEQFFKLLLSLVSDKLRKRIFIHGKNLNDLTDALPQKYLPKDYGGENGSLDQLCADYNKVWDEYREYFKQNAEYGTDERLRQGKPINFEDMFGLGGSFRKIEVD